MRMRVGSGREGQVKALFVFRPVARYRKTNKRQMPKIRTQFALTGKPNPRFGYTDICSLSVTTAVSRGDPCYVGCVLSVPWSETRYLVLSTKFCQTRNDRTVSSTNSDSSITTSSCSLNIVRSVGCSSSRV